MLGRVINATGVLLHTNLGRAPIGATALDAMLEAAAASNVEYDIDRGARGSRHDHAGDLLARACGAEAGIVVNNNAAAVVLVLAALARDREVIVSRGELVEIGGGFRVPEILAETGAHLIEVGTTNRTKFTDYSRMINERTAMLLKVHASNYRMIGFTQATPVSELTGTGCLVVVDAGSGLLDERTPWLAQTPAWLRDEPGVRQCIEDGADLVTFSGDKLLGGPQAGIIVGRKALIDVVKQHPLARALRADKMTLAGLQSVACSYLDNDATAIPLWRMATTTNEELHDRAEAIIAASGLAARAHIAASEAVAGGGSLPGLTIPSVAIAIRSSNVDATLRHLRVEHRIVATARDGEVALDLRSVDPYDDATVADALRASGE